MTIIRPDYTPRLIDEHATPSLRAAAGELRVAVLHNRKHNADMLMSRLAKNLAADLGGRVVSIEGKDHAAMPAPQALVSAAARAHVVITGSAD